MRIAAKTLTLWAALLLLLGSPGAARAASSCPDILVGDSLAVGMGPYARAAGFEVIARMGIGLSWLRAQSPRCARRVVVVIGTNDLRGIDPYSAEAYPERLAAIMSRWDAQQIIWATPGCFPHDQSLERGSEALDRALAREPLVRVGSGHGYMRVHSGRPARCSYLAGDGIHATGTGYRVWWTNLSQSIGPAPDGGEPYRETRTLEARAREPVRATRQARLERPGRPARHSVHLARTDRRGRPVQVARVERDRRGRPILDARADRRRPAAQQARMDARGRPVQQARSDARGRPVQQARAEARERMVQQARPGRSAPQAGVQQARPAPQAHAPRDARFLRLPPARQASTPTRRT